MIMKETRRRICSKGTIARINDFINTCKPENQYKIALFYQRKLVIKYGSSNRKFDPRQSLFLMAVVVSILLFLFIVKPIRKLLEFQDPWEYQYKIVLSCNLWSSHVYSKV